MLPRAWGIGPRIPALAIATVGGLAAALVAWRWPLAPLWLAAGLALLAGVALAGRFPGATLALLLILVLVQDPLVAAGLTPLQMADEALVLVALAGLLGQAIGRGRLSRSPLDLPTAAFLLIALLSAAVQQVPAWVAALGTVALAKGLAAFHLAARLPDPRQAARRGLPWLLGLAAATAAVALVQRLGGAPVYQLMGRLDYYEQWQGTKAPSIYFNHNSLGHVMVLAGLTLLAVALSAPALAALGRATRPARMAALLCLGGLVVSASREAWLAAMAGLMVLAILGRSRRHWLLALAVCLVLALGGLGVYAGSTLLRAEIARRTAGVWEGWRLYRMGYSGWSYRGEYRVYNILKSWEIFLDQPLLGTGPGRFGGATAVRYPSPVYAAYDFLPLNGAYIPLDVFWSRLLTEFGLFGAAAYLACLAAYGRIAWRLVPARDPLLRALGLAAAMALAAVLMLGLFSPALEDPLSSIPFWALGGLAWALGRQRRVEERSSGPTTDPATVPTADQTGDRTSVRADDPTVDRASGAALAPVLVVSNMWPGAADPTFGVFVAGQVAALEALGVPIAVCFIDGRAGKLNYLLGIRRIRTQLRRGLPAATGDGPARSFQLVHAHYVLSGLAALLAGARRPQRPLLVTHHGIEVFEGWQAPLARLVSRLADRSLVISPAMATHLGLDTAAVLPCGIDLQRFRPMNRAAACAELGLDASRRRIAWVGADRPEKRLALARQVAGLLAARRSDVDLHVVSQLPPDRVPTHLAACDVLLVTSSREGGPLVVKEALAMQLPVVSTAVGDVAALLDGLRGCAVVDESAKHGEAIDDGDRVASGPELLAARLAAALDRALDAALDGEPGAAARERVMPFSQERIATRLLAIYTELQQQAQRRSSGS